MSLQPRVSLPLISGELSVDLSLSLSRFVLVKNWLRNLESETGILADGTRTLKQVLIQVPGIVFARGPAVAVLILLESDDGETFAVLTEQVFTFRMLCWNYLLELPAGMLDDDEGDFVGTAVREGGCDEEMSVFLYRLQVEQETIRQLQDKETGLREHGEFIKVRLVPYRELWRKTADAKVLVSIGFYEMPLREGLVPTH
ncbi:hypothetical protein Bca52824_011532 [Brassica carinata]|uniref:Uncharacterized protein n=1 Tax=Brassica carinata TaxID=52824 RepID=A0A8X7WFI4_BRACI|nr:hypothetical protein Bca52824_011532 [Brassica carinata]